MPIMLAGLGIDDDVYKKLKERAEKEKNTLYGLRRLIIEQYLEEKKCPETGWDAMLIAQQHLSEAKLEIERAKHRMYMERPSTKKKGELLKKKAEDLEIWKEKQRIKNENYQIREQEKEKKREAKRKEEEAEKRKNAEICEQTTRMLYARSGVPMNNRKPEDMFISSTAAETEEYAADDFETEEEKLGIEPPESPDTEKIIN